MHTPSGHFIHEFALNLLALLSSYMLLFENAKQGMGTYSRWAHAAGVIVHCT